MNDNNLEKIISQVLILIESGKSPREILAMLPEYGKELREIFQILDLLSVQKEKVAPSKELLTKILASLPSAKSVTEVEVSRYLYRGEQKPNDYAWQEGRPSETIIKPKIHDLMTINWKVWTPLGTIAVVALVIIGSYQFGTKAPQAPVTGETPQTPVAEESLQAPVAGEERRAQPIVVKPATGNVDDAVNAILAGISDDQALFADAEKDAALVNADSQAISNFGQSYNANEF